MQKPVKIVKIPKRELKEFQGKIDLQSYLNYAQIESAISNAVLAMKADSTHKVRFSTLNQK